MKKIILVIYLLININAVSQCDFNAITVKTLYGGDSTFYTSSSIAIDKFGIPYIVYCDSNDSLKTTVKKYLAGNWITLGNSSFSEDSVKYSSIEIDTNNTPYVAYLNSNTRKITVKKFNGTGWVNVGIPNFSIPGYKLAPIVISPNNIPYITFLDDATSEVVVMKFNGVAWITVGVTGISMTGLNVPSIAINSIEEPYIFHPENLIVKKYNGTSWVPLYFLTSATGPVVSGKCIVIDKNDIPHIVYKGIGGGANVMKFNGTLWINEGNASGNPNSIAIDTAGNVLVMTSHSNKIWITNATDNFVLQSIDLGVIDSYPTFAISPTNSNIYMTFLSKKNNNSLTVLCHKPLFVNSGLSFWNLLGVTGLGKQPVLAVGSDSSIYMAYSDHLYEKNITTMKYKNSNWEITAQSYGLKLGINNYLDFTIDNYNYPYYAFSDSLTSQINVYKESTILGSANFSYGQAKYISIKCNNNSVPSTPFVSYTDGGYSDKAVVKVFNGMLWQDVGGAFFSAGACKYNKMILDDIGLPYVVFSDLTNAGKATVMRYNGTNWVNVGLPGFSDGQASYTSIAFDTVTKTPYVIYKDHFYNSKATVMKFNGTSWTVVGVKGFTADSVNSTDITINRYGIPQITYSNPNIQDQVEVKKYDGVNWINEGGNNFPYSNCKNPSIISDKFGKTFVGFDSKEIVVYKLDAIGGLVEKSQICSNSSIHLIAEGGNNFSWLGPNNFVSSFQSPVIVNTSTLNAGTYSLSITNGTCVINDIVEVDIDNTCQDIWPGDANSDGIADNLDILELGLHFTQTGLARITPSNIWQSFYSANWSGTISNGKNLNHSDCNGDGIINHDDTLAIYDNYGFIHAFKLSGNQSSINPDINIIPDQNNVYAGNWGTSSIFLGETTNPISNVNGIAYTINYDNLIIEQDSIYITNQNSFIDVGQNLHFQKIDFTSGELYTANTHTNNTNVNGFGKIATLHYKIRPDITISTPLNLSISQAVMSNSNGSITPITSGTTSVIAIGASVGIKDYSNTSNLLIYPNPVKDVLTIELSSVTNNKINIYNALGQLVLSELISTKQVNLNTSNFTKGLYIVEILNGNSLLHKAKIVKE